LVLADNHYILSKPEDGVDFLAITNYTVSLYGWDLLFLDMWSTKVYVYSNHIRDVKDNASLVPYKFPSVERNQLED